MSSATSRNFNARKNFQPSFCQCEEIIEQWLDEKQLCLSRGKKEKLKIALVKYFSNHEVCSRHNALEKLHALCDSSRAPESAKQDEVEVWRLLGCAHPRKSQRGRMGICIYAIIFSVALASITTSLFHSYLQDRNFLAYLGMGDKLVTKAQLEQIEDLIDIVLALDHEIYSAREETGDELPHKITRQDIYRTIIEPMGVYAPDKISQSQYRKITQLLKNWILHLQKRKHESPR